VVKKPSVRINDKVTVNNGTNNYVSNVRNSTSSFDNMNISHISSHNDVSSNTVRRTVRVDQKPSDYESKSQKSSDNVLPVRGQANVLMFGYARK